MLHPVLIMNTSLTRLAQAIREIENFVLIMHISPDGDTAGSAAALCHILKNMGKTCRVFCRDELPASLDVLKDETGEFVFGLINPEEEGVIPEKTAAIAVDCADAGRMGEYAALFEKCAFRFVIDHHKTNAGFGDISFIRPYPATAQLIMELADELGAYLDANTAKCLYVAFLTDTGRFAYSGVTEQTMRAAGRLYGFGIDTADIARQLFSVRTLSKTKLLGRALELLETAFDGRACMIFMNREQYAPFDTEDCDNDGIVNYALDVKGCEIAVFAHEREKGLTKVSLRSAGRADVSRIAQAFGGGGHTLAAGCCIEGDFENVPSELMRRIKAALEELPEESGGA